MPLLALMGVPAATVEVLDYEYQILVTSMLYGVEALAALYRDRGDAENLLTNSKTSGVGQASPRANCASVRPARA